MTTGRAALAAAYVVAVGGLATSGVITQTPLPLLCAALITLPSGGLALAAYYGVYGVLALVPGADHDTSTGSGGCTAAGVCHETSTGVAATWFSVTTDSLAIVLLVAAAIANVVLLRWLLRLRSRSAEAARRTAAPLR